ncbi:MAG: hypothetical protein ACPIOQ_85695, partial [Promethearchaeia archaeon]
MPRSIEKPAALPDFLPLIDERVTTVPTSRLLLTVDGKDSGCGVVAASVAPLGPAPLSGACLNLTCYFENAFGIT